MISVIIVHYKNNEDLIECLDSFYKQKNRNFEVIIVDNSENRNIKNKLSRYTNLKYVSSSRNVGYGAGINMGAKYSKGEYLFVLNPDTIFEDNIIDKLLEKIKKDKKIGIIAPLLLAPDGNIMDQGAQELTPIRAIFKFSFIDKIWKNNPVSKNYWVKRWGSKLKQVNNVPGSAFIIRNDLFEKIDGFDEKFFLYFEEFDLCKRVRELGYEIYIDPNSKLIHKWGTSTKLLADKDEIFKKSRFYYFRKHFGLLKASIVELFLNINFNNLVLFSIVLAAAALRLYKIDEFIPFYGDIGWFFISARDMLLTGNIPLVGITSSHVWLHQGPIWTYILSIILYVYDFNPIAPYYFTAILDVFTLLLIYKLVKYSFSKKEALISSILYAFSPIVVFSARTAYHTSPIPFFVALFIYSLFKWINGNKYFFPLIVFSLAVLYNLELQTIVLFFIFMLIFIYGYIKKTSWYESIKNTKLVVISILALLTPMLPILIHDVKNGFPQTIVFVGWIFYKLFNISGNVINNSPELFTYLFQFFQKLFFLPSGLLATLIIILSLISLLFKLISDFHKKNIFPKHLLLALILITLLISIVVINTPSDAYLLSIFVPIIITLAVFFGSFAKNRYSLYLILFILLILGGMNAYTMFKNNYYIGFEKGYGPSFKDRIQASKYMVENSNGKPFYILGRGDGSQFESFTMNYKYLTWYLGGESAGRNSKIKYIIEESPYEIKVKKVK